MTKTKSRLTHFSSTKSYIDPSGDCKWANKKSQEKKNLSIHI